MDAAAAKASEWPAHTGVAKDLAIGDYLDVIGDGHQGRDEQLVCRIIASILPATRRGHLEIRLSAATAKGERARWSVHKDYPVTYRRGDWSARRELQIGR